MCIFVTPGQPESGWLKDDPVEFSLDHGFGFGYGHGLLVALFAIHCTCSAVWGWLGYTTVKFCSDFGWLRVTRAREILIERWLQYTTPYIPNIRTVCYYILEVLRK